MGYVVILRGNTPVDRMFPSWQLTAMSKLRAYRTGKGLSQEDFAKSVGVQKAAISRIEQGKRVPSMGLVARIVEASGGELSADDFMPATPTEQAGAA